MYVKLYRYKIKKNYLQKHNKIMKSADKIYSKYGKAVKWVVVMKKEGKYISIIDMSYYKSKKDFQKISKKVKKDKTIQQLYREFKKTQYSKRVVEEDFVSLSL